MRKRPLRPPTVSATRKALRARVEPGRAARNAWFFKTGPGDYGEGDRFLGVTLPDIRTVARESAALPLSAVIELLSSRYHEERLLALIILVHQHDRGDPATQRRVRRAYLANMRQVNNWDLVDCSAPQIVGAHVAAPGGRAALRRLAHSRSLWERRIAMLATFYFIRKRDDMRPTLQVAAWLIDDRHDLIQKAVGWMLREVGKRDRAAEERFLARHCRTMGRTALRYAIEHFPERRRQQYLRGDIA